jgi:hypothetical protein
MQQRVCRSRLLTARARMDKAVGWQMRKCANALAVAEIFAYVVGLGEIQKDIVYTSVRDAYKALWEASYTKWDRAIASRHKRESGYNRCSCFRSHIPAHVRTYVHGARRGHL